MSKPRKLPYQIIAEGDVVLAGQPYEILREVRAEQHFDTAEARIALAWRKGTKADVDGRLVLGRCVRLSDLQRELAPYDYVIVLNREVWEDPEFDRAKKLALLDHEMCHAAPVVDDDGTAVRDTKGRLCWRSRKHDIEEFTGIVERHGCYKRDLQRFAEALRDRRKGEAQAPLLARDPEFLDALGRMVAPVDGAWITSLTLSMPGMEPGVIDEEAALRLRRAASQANRKRSE